MKKYDYLFVVAHPDDEVITCGGLLYDHSNSSFVLLATNRWQDNFELVYEQLQKFKINMSNCGCRYDNLKKEAYKFSHSDKDCVDKIREIAEQSLCVVTHHPKDFNRDHSELSKMVILATRDLDCDVLFMNSYAPEKISSFRGDVLYNYSSSGKKMEMLELYDNERYNKYYVMCRDSMNSTNGKSYVELYETYRRTLLRKEEQGSSASQMMKEML